MSMFIVHGLSVNSLQASIAELASTTATDACMVYVWSIVNCVTILCYPFYPLTMLASSRFLHC